MTIDEINKEFEAQKNLHVSLSCSFYEDYFPVLLRLAKLSQKDLNEVEVYTSTRFEISAALEELEHIVPYALASEVY